MSLFFEEVGGRGRFARVVSTDDRAFFGLGGNAAKKVYEVNTYPIHLLIIYAYDKGEFIKREKAHEAHEVFRTRNMASCEDVISHLSKVGIWKFGKALNKKGE